MDVKPIHNLIAALNVPEGFLAAVAIESSALFSHRMTIHSFISCNRACPSWLGRIHPGQVWRSSWGHIERWPSTDIHTYGRQFTCTACFWWWKGDREPRGNPHMKAPHREVPGPQVDLNPRPSRPLILPSLLLCHLGMIMLTSNFPPSCSLLLLSSAVLKAVMGSCVHVTQERCPSPRGHLGNMELWLL